MWHQLLISGHAADASVQDDSDSGVGEVSQALSSCGPYNTTLADVQRDLQFRLSYINTDGKFKLVILDRSLTTQLSKLHPHIPFATPWYPTLDAAYVAFKNQLGCHIITSVDKAGKAPTLKRDLLKYFVG